MPWSISAPRQGDIDDALFAEILDTSEGAVPLQLEVASRCVCYTDDSAQPKWDCPSCGGTGVQYATPAPITGLFRSQGRWLSFRREGEFDHGEASLTTALSIRPGYTDRRVRDRITATAAATDLLEGRVFYPAAPAVPFIFAGLQRAWRVQLQSNRLPEVTPA